MAALNSPCFAAAFFTPRDYRLPSRQATITLHLHRNCGRTLLRGPRHQRIADDQIPDRRREVGDEDLAEALRDGNPGPLSPFEPLEIGGPLSAWRDGEEGLGDEAPVSNHGAEEEFEEGQGGAV